MGPYRAMQYLNRLADLPAFAQERVWLCPDQMQRQTVNRFITHAF